MVWATPVRPVAENNGQKDRGMKLSINYELPDEDAVRGITSLCDELGLEYTLEESDDWLTHALRPASEDSIHMLLVISPVTTTSGWLPFQLGRAAGGIMGIFLVIGLVFIAPLVAAQDVDDLYIHCSIQEFLRKSSRSGSVGWCLTTQPSL